MLLVIIRVVLDSFFRADSTLTHMKIRVTQLRLNSNPKFANLTQLRLNSKPKFTNLTQLWLNSFESELSQIWLTTHHILPPNLGKSCSPGGGGRVRSNVAVCWSFPCKVTDNCEILTFSPRKIIDSTLTQAVSSWLNSDSNDDQRDSTLTRLISLIFTADSTLTQLIWVRVESNLTHDWWVEHNPGYNCFLLKKRPGILSKFCSLWISSGENLLDSMLIIWRCAISPSTIFVTCCSIMERNLECTYIN